MSYRALEKDALNGSIQSRVELLCEKGLISEAIQAVRLGHEQGLRVSPDTLYHILQGCVSKQDVVAGREAYQFIIKAGVEFNSVLCRGLIRMFAVCGALSEANHVFSRLTKFDAHVLMAIISANSKHGQDEKAIEFYRQIQELGISPDGHVASAIVKSCIAAKAFTTGKIVHFQVIERSLELDAFVGNVLIDMYTKYGRFEDAWGVFKRLANRDLVTWSTMIGSYVDYGQPLQALQAFWQMQEEGFEPDHIILLCILRACSSLAAVTEGRLLHAYIVKSSLESEASVVNTLMDIYAKGGCIEDAKKLFDELQRQDLVAWNVIIMGYVSSGQVESALSLYSKLLGEAWLPNHVTLIAILKACSQEGPLTGGILIHCDITESDLDSNVSLGNSLIDMYAKNNRLADARCIFVNLPDHNVVTWNAMIGGYAHHGHRHETFTMFQHLLQIGVELNDATFISTLKAFTCPESLFHGKVTHCHLFESCVACNLQVSNALISMYTSCGSLESGLHVFDDMPIRDIVTWNTMINGCVKLRCNEKAWQLSQQMQEAGIEADETTCNCMLKMTSATAALLPGRLVHGFLIAHGFDANILIGNSLLDMYCKCESLEEACNVFTSLPHDDVVTWNVMLEGHTLHGYGEQACQLFKQLQQVGVLPDQGTFIAVMKVVPSLAALQQIHVQVLGSIHASDMPVRNGLLNTYATCGSLEAACHVFDRMREHDVVVWCSMIALCAKQSYPKLALKYYMAMQQAGVVPTDSTAVNLLSSFSHAGEVDRGFSTLEPMMGDHAAPSVDFCNGMVDLLGRAGQLNEAEDFLHLASSSSTGSNLAGWMSLLSNCRIHGNVDIARRCLNQLSSIDVEKAAGYVLMSHAYANAGMKEDMVRLEELRKSVGAWKTPGKSSIEVNNSVHEFLVGGQACPMVGDLFAKLKRLLKDEGYVPQQVQL